MIDALRLGVTYPLHTDQGGNVQKRFELSHLLVRNPDSRLSLIFKIR